MFILYRKVCPFFYQFICLCLKFSGCSQVAELSCQLGEHVTCSPPKGAKSVVRFDYENNLVCHAQLVIAPMLYRSGTLGGKRVTSFRERWLATQLM